MVRRGFSLIDVMMALVILGVVMAIFTRTSNYSTRNQGKTRSWEGEGAVVEKTMESLRSDYTMTQLQSLSGGWVDSSQGGIRYRVDVNGSVAADSVATSFPQNMLAQMHVCVRKVGDSDSLVVTTLLWVN